MESIFIKCDCHSHGMEVETYKEDSNPNKSEFIFSIWQYGKKSKPSIQQRLKYLLTGKNDLISESIILDIKKATDLSKYLTSNIDKINLEIKKHNSSPNLIKDLMIKTEKNLETILKNKPKKPKKEVVKENSDVSVSQGDNKGEVSKG